MYLDQESEGFLRYDDFKATFIEDELCRNQASCGIGYEYRMKVLREFAAMKEHFRLHEPQAGDVFELQEDTDDENEQDDSKSLVHDQSHKL